MKKIEAYLKPFRLAETRDALAEARFDVIRVHAAEEIRPAEAYTEVVQGMEYERDVVPRALIVLLVEDGDLDEAIQVIQGVARTDHRGDGRIVVTNVELITAVNPQDAPDSEIPGRHVG
ncbi:MAG: P-II family nitrogen regulator [Planctomycetes bacterium]|nr:P-II family nitrogen regulator [Planctomycetota bacterium]